MKKLSPNRRAVLANYTRELLRNEKGGGVARKERRGRGD